jgi:hypothetical protein
VWEPPPILPKPPDLPTYFVSRILTKQFYAKCQSPRVLLCSQSVDRVQRTSENLHQETTCFSQLTTRALVSRQGHQDEPARSPPSRDDTRSSFRLVQRRPFQDQPRIFSAACVIPQLYINS